MRKIIVLLGAPGSGKGTQAVFIKEMGLKHISTGEILREEVKKGTELGKRVKSIMEKGELVSDDIINELMFNVVRENSGGLLFDGYPRNITQAESFDEFLKGENLKVDYVIYLDVSEDTCKKRLSGRFFCPECKKDYNIYFSPPKNDRLCDNCGKELIQRDDDKENVVEERLKVYFEKTYPLIEYYEKKNLLYKVNGEREIREIKEEIRRILKNGSIKEG